VDGDHGRRGGEKGGSKVGDVGQFNALAATGARKGNLLKPELGYILADGIKRRGDGMLDAERRKENGEWRMGVTCILPSPFYIRNEYVFAFVP
jgi:hypothetical protein